MSLSGLDSGHPQFFAIFFRAAAIQTREIELFQKTNLCSCFRAWRQTLAANMNSNEKKVIRNLLYFFPIYNQQDPDWCRHYRVATTARKCSLMAQAQDQRLSWSIHMPWARGGLSTFHLQNISSLPFLFKYAKNENIKSCFIIYSNISQSRDGKTLIF